jgi:hypothetical protein
MRKLVIRSEMSALAVAAGSLLTVAGIVFQWGVDAMPYAIVLGLVGLVWAMAWPLTVEVERGRFRLRSMFGTRFQVPLAEVQEITVTVEERGSGKNRYTVYPVRVSCRSQQHEMDACDEYLPARRLSESLAAMLAVPIVDCGMGQSVRRNPDELDRRWIDTVPCTELPGAPARLTLFSPPPHLLVRLPGHRPIYWFILLLASFVAGVIAYNLSDSAHVTAATSIVVVILGLLVLAPPTVEAARNYLAIRYPFGLTDRIDLAELEEMRTDDALGGLLLVCDYRATRIWSPLEEHEVEWLKQAIAWSVRQ